MDYEKKYKEALKKARQLCGYPTTGPFINDLQDLFPELAESEDEKIRESLLEYLHTLPNHYSHDGVCAPEWIAWLEKQKTSEEALQYLKENHSPSEISDFQAAMNIAVAKAYDKGMKDGLEKQGDHANFLNGIQIGDKVTRNEDGVLVNLSQLKRVAKPADKVEPFDKYDGLTDFERTLANICIGWIGEELGWKQYIKDNADVLLKIAIKKLEKWLKEHILDYAQELSCGVGKTQPYYYTKHFIEDLKNYMEE